MPFPEVKIGGEIEFPSAIATFVTALTVPRVADTNLYATEYVTVN